MANVFVATRDALINVDGVLHSIKKDITRVVEGHSILKDHPELFKPAEQDAHFAPVRTARAEPKAAKAEEPKPSK